jgi:hypothetical protein
MAKRNVIRGVLRNFLGTYTSRYTDYRGYWLFGFLVSDLGELDFDLLDQAESGLDTPLAVSKRLAAARFADQLRKAGLNPSRVREARLRIRRSPELTKCWVNGPARAGYNVAFRVLSLMDNGRAYECEHVVTVARHDPLIEQRSARRG